MDPKAFMKIRDFNRKDSLLFEVSFGDNYAMSLQWWVWESGKLGYKGGFPYNIDSLRQKSLEKIILMTNYNFLYADFFSEI